MISLQQKKSTQRDRPMLSNAAATVQTKLSIGSPNDRYEREADAMADRIMRMPQQGFSSQPWEVREPVSNGSVPPVIMKTSKFAGSL